MVKIINNHLGVFNFCLIILFDKPNGLNDCLTGLNVFSSEDNGAVSSTDLKTNLGVLDLIKPSVVFFKFL